MPSVMALSYAMGTTFTRPAPPAPPSALSVYAAPAVDRKSMTPADLMAQQKQQLRRQLEQAKRDKATAKQEFLKAARENDNTAASLAESTMNAADQTLQTLGPYLEQLTAQEMAMSRTESQIESTKVIKASVDAQDAMLAKSGITVESVAETKAKQEELAATMAAIAEANSLSVGLPVAAMGESDALRRAKELLRKEEAEAESRAVAAPVPVKLEVVQVVDDDERAAWASG